MLAAKYPLSAHDPAHRSAPAHSIFGPPRSDFLRCTRTLWCEQSHWNACADLTGWDSFAAAGQVVTLTRVSSEVWFLGLGG